MRVPSEVASREALEASLPHDFTARAMWPINLAPDLSCIHLFRRSDGQRLA